MIIQQNSQSTSASAGTVYTLSPVWQQFGFSSIDSKTVEPHLEDQAVILTHSPVARKKTLHLTVKLTHIKMHSYHFEGKWAPFMLCIPLFTVSKPLSR